MRFNLVTVSLALLSGVAQALTADEKASLDRQNQGRVAKGLPKLEWDAGLQKKAQDYANQLVRIDQLVHSGVGGENLYWQSAGGNPLKNAAVSWMNEESVYKGQKIPEGNFLGYGHYTQCMWKTTKKVGIAAAKTKAGATYVVARYDPAGNMVGKKPY